MKIEPTIIEQQTAIPAIKTGNDRYMPNLTSQSDSFECSSAAKKPKKNIFSKLFDKIKSLFSPKQAEETKEQIQISDVHQSSSVSFKGIDVSNTKTNLLRELKMSSQEVGEILKSLKEPAGLDEISSMLELYKITPKEFANEINRQKEIFDGENELAFCQVIENLKLYPIITEDNNFTPFKLSFEEESKISEGVTSGNISAIYDVLKKNNPDVGKMFEKDSIIERNLHSIYQKMALNNYVLINPDNLVDLGKMNGRNKKIIFPNSTGIPPAKTVNMDAKTLIKSNLITMELIEATKDVPLPKVKKLKSITSEKITVNPEQIREKAAKYGIDSLSTYEIHALTDCFTDEPKIIEAANKIINNTSNPTNKQLRQLLGYAEHLSKLAQPVLKGSKVKIDNHAFLRMLDRNMVSVADNNKGRLLSFQELIEVIKNAAEKEMKTVSPLKEINISGYKNGSGIKLLVNYNPDGTCIIDSIM